MFQNFIKVALGCLKTSPSSSGCVGTVVWVCGEGRKKV